MGQHELQQRLPLLNTTYTLLETVRMYYAVAQRAYREALRLDLTNVEARINPDFPEMIRKDYDGAQQVYHEALVLVGKEAAGLCARLLTGEDFHASFSRFDGDQQNGFTNVKFARVGQGAKVKETFSDLTVTLVFSDGEQLDFPVESFVWVEHCPSRKRCVKDTTAPREEHPGTIAGCERARAWVCAFACVYACRHICVCKCMYL